MAEESFKSRYEREFSSTTLPEELEKLAEDKNEEGRWAVARNANAPASVLEKLAEDKEEFVSRADA